MTDGERVRVVLADDELMQREGLRRVLEDGGFEVVAAAADATGLVGTVGRHRPDVVILDIRMPPTHTTEGLDAAADLQVAFPELGVLMLSKVIETRHVSDLLADRTAGIGYLLKGRIAHIDEFLDAVRSVARGMSVIDPDVLKRLMGKPRIDDPMKKLSAKEREVLVQMGRGLSNQAIADTLTTSVRTVEKHVANIFLRFDLADSPEVNRRVRAVVDFLREN